MKNVIKYVKLVKSLNDESVNNYCFIKMVDIITINSTFNCFFATQSGNYSINQSSHYIYSVFSTDLISKETSTVWNNIVENTLANIDFFIFLVLFSKTVTF